MWSNTSPRYSPPKHWFFISCLQQIIKAFINSVFKLYHWKERKLKMSTEVKYKEIKKIWKWTSFNGYMWAWTNVWRCTSSSSILHSDTSPSSNLYHLGWLSSPLKARQWHIYHQWCIDSCSYTVLKPQSNIKYWQRKKPYTGIYKKWIYEISDGKFR